MTLSFTRITFTSEFMVDPTCSSELCRHCHAEDYLTSTGLTGTGENFKSLSLADRNKLSLGEKGASTCGNAI